MFKLIVEDINIEKLDFKLFFWKRFLNIID